MRGLFARCANRPGGRSPHGLFLRRLMSRSDVKRAQCAGPEPKQASHARRPRMRGLFARCANRPGGRSPHVLFRRRLMSHSGVKRTQCAGRSQNRQLMRGGRA